MPASDEKSLCPFSEHDKGSLVDYTRHPFSVDTFVAPLGRRGTPTNVTPGSENCIVTESDPGATN